MELRYIADSAARTQALVSGQVDVINPVDPKTAGLLARNKSLRLSRIPGMGNRCAFVDQTDKSPFSNNDMMPALKFHIDRKKRLQAHAQARDQVGPCTVTTQDDVFPCPRKASKAASTTSSCAGCWCSGAKR